MLSKEPKGTLEIQVVAMPGDTNANGDIFGGWLVSHMDMAAGIASRRCANSRAVTVAIDSLIFIKPVNVGDTVSCYVNLLTTGKTSMKFEVDVWTTCLENSLCQKVAQGIFTFVAIDENGRPQPVRRKQ